MAKTHTHVSDGMDTYMCQGTQLERVVIPAWWKHGRLRGNVAEAHLRARTCARTQSQGHAWCAWLQHQHTHMIMHMHVCCTEALLGY